MMSMALAALVTAPPATAETRLVTSPSNSGAGTLRAQIQAATDGDTIEIVAGVDPVLSSEIPTAKQLVIRGQGAGATTVIGAGTRIFRIEAAGTVTLERWRSPLQIPLSASKAARSSTPAR